MTRKCKSQMSCCFSSKAIYLLPFVFLWSLPFHLQKLFAFVIFSLGVNIIVICKIPAPSYVQGKILFLLNCVYFFFPERIPSSSFTCFCLGILTATFLLINHLPIGNWFTTYCCWLVEYLWGQRSSINFFFSTCLQSENYSYSAADEWKNFLARIGRDENAIETELFDSPNEILELQFWASYRGQTLARTGN